MLIACVVVAIAAGLMLRTPMATSEPGRTVAAYFDRPPPWPGPAWKVVPNRTASWPEIDASAGAAECGWDALTFLTIGWPLGNASPNAPFHQYIRDPLQRLTGAHLSGTWAHNPAIPGDATDTGFHYGSLKLVLGSDADRYAYIVAPADSERWPRLDPPAACD